MLEVKKLNFFQELILFLRVFHYGYFTHSSVKKLKKN